MGCSDGSCSAMGPSSQMLMDPPGAASAHAASMARGCTDGSCGATVQSRGCCGSSGGGCSTGSCGDSSSSSGSCGSGGGCGSSSGGCGSGGGCGEASSGGKRRGLFARMFGGAKTTTMAVAATELAALQIDYSMYLS